MHCHFVDCTFGYFRQTAANSNFQAIVTSSGGANNVNVNIFENCKFFDGGTTVATVTITAGLEAIFTNCAWENNGRDLSTINVQNLRLVNCYTERGKHATSQFQFLTARTRSLILGGQFNGGLLPSGASMFRASEDSAFLIEDADIGTSASSFTYTNANNSVHTLPTNGQHQFRNCRISGNASDPLLWLDNLLEDTPKTFTPSFSGLTIVNGTGGVTYSGIYSIRNRIVTFVAKMTVTGTATIANTASNTTFMYPIADIPLLPQFDSTIQITNSSQSASQNVGTGFIYEVNGRMYLPTWSASNSNFIISGTYFI